MGPPIAKSFDVETTFSLRTFFGDSLIHFPRRRLAREEASGGSYALDFPAGDVTATPDTSPRVCGTSFWIPRRGPARAGPHFGNRNGPPRARDPVAVPVSTPRARAGPRRGSRDDPPRVRGVISGTAAASRTRGTPSRSPFRPLAHVRDPVGEPATALRACGTPPRFPFRGPARVLGRCKWLQCVVFAYLPHAIPMGVAKRRKNPINTQLRFFREI